MEPGLPRMFLRCQPLLREVLAVNCAALGSAASRLTLTGKCPRCAQEPVVIVPVLGSGPSHGCGEQGQSHQAQRWDVKRRLSKFILGGKADLQRAGDREKTSSTGSLTYNDWS